MFQVLAEDELTQRKGAVLVMAPDNEESEHDQHFDAKARVTNVFSNCMPLRISAYHVCVPTSPFLRVFVRLTLLIVPATIRSRLRVHEGSPLEWQYKLSSFGINAELLPFTSGGTVKKKAHHRWIKLRKAKEAAMKASRPFDFVECPNVEDVFFRRGGNLMSRSGNLMLREVLESMLALYRSRDNQEEKTQISWWVVGEVERRNGRFLIESPDGFWMELKNKDIVREKISNAFRDLRKSRACDNDYMIRTDSSTLKFACLDGRKRMRISQECLPSS